MDKTWIKTGSKKELLLNLLKEKMVKKNEWERFLENSKETFPLDEVTQTNEPEISLQNDYNLNQSIFTHFNLLSRSLEGIESTVDDLTNFKLFSNNSE